MKIPITQSSAWRRLQEDLGEVSYEKKGTGYQYLAIYKSTPVANYLYLPYGPVTEGRRGFENALKDLKNLATRKNITFVRIEPQSKEVINYLPKQTHKVHDLSPKDTWVLDLAPEKSDIIANFAQGTRTRYNTFAKKGLTVEVSNELLDIKHLVKLQNKLYKSKNLNSFSEQYLKTELKQPFASLYLVKYHQPAAQSESKPPTPTDGQVLAASLFFDYKNTRYYMQSAADLDFKKLPSTVALLTTAIFDAKEKGIKHFDFWGIAPDDAAKNHPWAGFTEFKKSFGGRPVHYAGTYDIVLKPFRYRVYRLFRKLNRMIKK